MRYIVAILSVLLLSGCFGSDDTLSYTSPSGMPTVTLTNISVSKAKSKVIDSCIESGFKIKEQNNSVVCWNKMEGLEGAFAKMLVGNSYSTDPTANRQIVLTQKGKNVRLVGSRMWMESQMAFGQVRQEDLDSNQQLNEFQSFLESIK